MHSLVTRSSQAASLVLIAVLTGCATATPSAEGPSNTTANAPTLGTQGLFAAAADDPIPATDPAIQQWFLDNDGAKVDFNNALLGAEQAVARKDATGCQPLQATTATLVAALPALEQISLAGQKLASAMQTPLTTFAGAATTCLASDFAGAQIALDLGVSQQADAQESVDEILDGEL